MVKQHSFPTFVPFAARRARHGGWPLQRRAQPDSWSRPVVRSFHLLDLLGNKVLISKDQLEVFFFFSYEAEDVPRNKNVLKAASDPGRHCHLLLRPQEELTV